MINQPVSVSMNHPQRELLERAERVDYKVSPGGDPLSLHAFHPHGPGGERPAIVFFHGCGSWVRGELSQFAPQCLHFAARGVVAVAADYRVGGGSRPQDAVEDVRDAVAWIRDHSEQLGVDPDKVVLAGASSGAHAVLASVMSPDVGLAVQPAAMLLFSPIINVTRDRLAENFGDKQNAKAFSPLHQIRKGQPPMIVFHARGDRVQSAGEVETFAKKMAKKKNQCELTVYHGEGQSFFNFNVNASLYEATLNSADDFLVRVGVLSGGSDGAATTRLVSWR